ncbi:DUF1134 domain-containing protein [Sphingomonas sp. PL-96]|uniref:DUF1134 domain-containing protein n=1 Tax=Sphingomonas sp. PL-96 TaxID=2887201 RepID=UPI001E5C29B5|nr:DUF1134 domain-containing protein [Sphingomonas sp. PL-96]MCC2977405.1 DUF1134 domain-containing protein [Sphingomonas sp. PL-96]
MRRFWLMLGSVAVAMATPAAAQMRTVDPNEAIDGDLDTAPAPQQPQAAPAPEPDTSVAPQSDDPAQRAPAPAAPAPAAPGATMASANTYEREDLINAAEGVFGKGAEGLAGILENILKDQGKPNAYIAGREAAGAFVVGLRYGSGVMSHRVEGQRPVYWTGPSVGFDVGGDATKVFVLVYNLYDSQELYHRFPQAEGRAYFVGGFSASYLRRGDVVLIPVRLGVGWRLGANIGYMKFSEKAKWMPF